MDTSTLRAVTEELAALLSEVTHGDLGRRVPGAFRDVGDLCLHLVDQNIRVAAAIAGEMAWPSHRTDPMDRATLAASLDFYGGGLEAEYRQTAQFMVSAFASVTAGSRLCRMDGLYDDVEVAELYEIQVSSSVVHAWDIAQALGFSYQPAPDVASRTLRSILSRPDSIRGNSGTSLDPSDILGCVLELSRRAS